MSTPFRLQVPRRILEEMIAQAVAELPQECCGLLGGRIVDESARPPLARVLQRYPLVNALGSATQFESAPFAAMRSMRTEGLEMLAIYHSHPTTHAVPSPTDLERSFYPDVMNFIISLQSQPPKVRGWWLTAVNYQEATWDEIE